MAWKIEDEAARAGRAFDEMRFFDAYLHYRRIYNQLPFAFHDLHTEHCGRFLKTLIGIGKQREVEFYYQQFREHYERSAGSALAIPLSYFASMLEPRPNALVRELMEKVVADKTAPHLQLRARMNLAYLVESTELALCHHLIESCDAFRDQDPDPQNRQLLEVWRAKVSKDRGRRKEARDCLQHVAGADGVHWFVYFSAQVVLANFWIEEKAWARARAVVHELREFFQGRSFRLVQFQMEALEKLLEDQPSVAEAFVPGEVMRRAPLPERDKFRKSDPGNFLRNRRWIGPRALVINLC